MKNSYYDIALDGLLYLQDTMHLPYYNQIAPQAQQIAEKMLKSVLELVISKDDDAMLKLMTGHNLRAIYDAIRVRTSFPELSRGSLALLKDYYYDARYPGEHFVIVTSDECAEAIDTMYEVIKAVNEFRQEKGLEFTEITPKKLF